MFTYSFFRNPKTGSLHLRLINNRRKAEMELGVKATEAEFSDARSSRPKTSNERLSLTLKGIENVVREVQMDFINLGLDQRMDVKEIREMVRRRVSPDEKEVKTKDCGDPLAFTSFFEKYMSLKTNEGTKATYRACLARIKEFCAAPDNPLRKKIEDLKLDDITRPWIVWFDDWMKKRGMLPNSRRGFLCNLHAVTEAAIDEDLIAKDPFRKFKLPAAQARKRAMSVEDLRKLFNYPVKRTQKLPIDMFKLIFMLIGINARDLYDLKGITKEGRIEYTRAKTGTFYSIKVEPEAMEIIERWRGKEKFLCISERTSYADNFTFFLNRNLKKIGECKITPGSQKKVVVPLFPEITVYWARHTWATIARRIGVSIDDIALCLGHKSSHRMTSIYIDEDRERIDTANRRVLDYVLYGRDWREEQGHSG